MSSSPENELDLDLHFLPAWAVQAPDVNRYSNFTGNEGDRPERRRPRREDGAGGRQDVRARRPRPTDRGPAGQPAFGAGNGGNRPPRPGGARPAHPGMRRRVDSGPGEAEDRRRLEPSAPVIELDVNLRPDEKGVDALAKQIRMTGRAYPLFEIAQLILQKPERHTITFTVKKSPQGAPIQPLYSCALDDTLWLSEDQAVAHVLQNHFATFYQIERLPTDGPKGTYTFVAQCGLSGHIFGPPNHHDYQNQLHKLHTEKFSRMPFEAYKAKVRIVRDEAVVKKWIEDQSWKNEYTCLNVPEALKFSSLEAVEKHFREIHMPVIIKSIDTITLPASANRGLKLPALLRLARNAWEDQRRFPIRIATVLSQQFASRGLQFFKVNKTVTHVAVSRPHFLDLAITAVSPSIKRIVEFIHRTPKCTRRMLLGALAPSGPAAQAASPAPLPAEQAAPEAPASTPATPPAPAAQPALSAIPSPEETAVISDLHWLIYQGHVIEFANGILDTAKRPLPRPEKPAPAPAPAPSPAAVAAEPAAGAADSPSESPSVDEEEPAAEVLVAGAAGSPDSLVTDAATPEPAEAAPDSDAPAFAAEPPPRATETPPP